MKGWSRSGLSDTDGAAVIRIASSAERLRHNVHVVSVGSGFGNRDSFGPGRGGLAKYPESTGRFDNKRDGNKEDG